MRILRSDEGIHEAHYKLGLVRSLKGDYKQALPAAAKATQLKPEEPTYCALMGRVWLALDEGGKGLEWLERALLQDSLQPEALLSRARYHSANDAWESALVDYTRLNQVVQNEPELHFRIGECHFEMQAFDKAKAWFTKTLKVNPLDLEARWLLSLTTYELGEYREGLFHVEQLIKMEGAVPQYNYQKGQFHRALAELTEARIAYRQALKGGKEQFKLCFRIGGR